MTGCKKTQRNTAVEMTMTKVLAFKTKERTSKHEAIGGDCDIYKMRPGAISYCLLVIMSTKVTSDDRDHLLPT